MKRTSHTGSLSLPAAIIVAAALIAVALIWINRPTSTDKTGTGSSNADTAQQGDFVIAPVTANEHILGNPNAPIKLVEYSDLSCPFCKAFNPTLVAIMGEYGPGGKVAWVYRHFPLMNPVGDQPAPHPNSGVQAEALECVAALGGNKAFFAFESKWFAAFPDDGAGRSASIDRAEIDKTAKGVGIDTISFADCLGSGRFKAKVAAAYDAGLAAGVTGTPSTVIFTPSGNKIPLIGSQTYSMLKSTIDTLITTIATSTSIQN